MPEVMNGIARTLKVSREELIKSKNEATVGLVIPRPLDDPHYELVRLQRFTSATKLAERIGIGTPYFEFDVDPDEELANQIADTVELIEALRKSRRQGFGSLPGGLSGADRIREIGRLNGRLNALSESGVHVYCGWYWYRLFGLRSDAPSDNQYLAEERIENVVRFSTEDVPYQTVKAHVGLTDQEIEGKIEKARGDGYHVEDERCPF